MLSQLSQSQFIIVAILAGIFGVIVILQLLHLIQRWNWKRFAKDVNMHKERAPLIELSHADAIKREEQLLANLRNASDREKSSLSNPPDGQSATQDGWFKQAQDEWVKQVGVIPNPNPTPKNTFKTTDRPSCLKCIHVDADSKTDEPCKSCDSEYSNYLKKDIPPISSTNQTMPLEVVEVKDITTAPVIEHESITIKPKHTSTPNCSNCVGKNKESDEEPCDSCENFSNYKRFRKLSKTTKS